MQIGRQSRAGRPRGRASLVFLRGAPSAAGLALLAGLAGASGCATKADLYKLEEKVMDSQRSSSDQPDPFERIAALSREVDQLREEQRRLEGQLEVAQKTADDALEESRRAREELARVSAAGGGTALGATAASEGDAVAPGAAIAGQDEGESTSAEVVAYKEALALWRADDHEACIKQFREFLQNHPDSPYADDALYWMADCEFKRGDYRVAVLRFNEVVRVYPNGNKAPDALYRQGETLLKLGPGFYESARKVFKQVLEEYPDSDRAREARQQLEAIGTG